MFKFLNCFSSLSLPLSLLQLLEGKAELYAPIVVSVVNETVLEESVHDGEHVSLAKYEIPNSSTYVSGKVISMIFPAANPVYKLMMNV